MNFSEDIEFEKYYTFLILSCLPFANILSFIFFIYTVINNKITDYRQNYIEQIEVNKKQQEILDKYANEIGKDYRLEK
jgi:hypothetical protein